MHRKTRVKTVSHISSYVMLTLSINIQVIELCHALWSCVTYSVSANFNAKNDNFVYKIYKLNVYILHYSTLKIKEWCCIIGCPYYEKFAGKCNLAKFSRNIPANYAGLNDHLLNKTLISYNEPWFTSPFMYIRSFRWHLDDVIRF